MPVRKVVTIEPKNNNLANAALIKINSNSAAEVIKCRIGLWHSKNRILLKFIGYILSIAILFL